MPTGCSTIGCHRPHYAKGLCSRCYQRQYWRNRAVRSATGNIPRHPPEEDVALPIVPLPLFSSGNPTDDEVEFKLEMLRRAIDIYEQELPRRRALALAKLRAEGPRAVARENYALDQAEQRLRLYRWMADFWKWLATHEPIPQDDRISAIQEWHDRNPIPMRKNYGLPE